ncbi:Ribose import permease protein RbsC [Starkeya nomas]|uniref:Ribose import permease protein RbsC n=1 Tax=Starkeya nomas TaxID=2666134 RepID=A0A5S9PAB9_9HYPH|nr:ABC transporter permease [Starkeya nomas]CAA0100647.1 Ribose import permease protein RbsC [Starkeya nomas]
MSLESSFESSLAASQALHLPRAGRQAPPPEAAASAPGLSRGALAGLLRFAGLLALLAVVAFFAVRVPSFLTPGNIGLILSQSAVLGILGLGLTLVLITGGSDVIRGGIDLSLAGTLGLAAAVFATLNQAGYGDAACVAATLATGLAVGALNALSVTWLRILPLLATLAVMNICAGLELVLTENTTVPAASPLIDALNLAGPFDLPVIGLVLVAAWLVLAVTLRFTPVGLRAYAVGGHPEAARAAGIALNRYVAGSYIVAGLLGGVAGILSVAFLNAATSGSADMLLPVIATAFLGRMFSRRLVPSVTGTLLAAVFLGALANGFQLLHVSSYWVNGIEGALILAVVGVTSGLAQRGARP